MFTEMMMSWHNRALGIDIDTRRLAVRTPVEFVDKTVHDLKTTWHIGNNIKHTFLISEAESITGRLGYVAETSPWLRFMMTSMYGSIAYALGESRAYLVKSDKNFHKLTAKVKNDLKFHTKKCMESTSYGKPAHHDTELRHYAYAISQASKKVHHSRVRF